MEVASVAVLESRDVAIDDEWCALAAEQRLRDTYPLDSRHREASEEVSSRSGPVDLEQFSWQCVGLGAPSPGSVQKEMDE